MKVTVRIRSGQWVSVSRQSMVASSNSESACVADGRVRAVEGEVFPVAVAWEQVKAKECSEAKDRQGLALRIGADRVGLQL